MLDEGFNKTLDHYSDNKEAWDFVQEKVRFNSGFTLALTSFGVYSYRFF